MCRYTSKDPSKHSEQDSNQSPAKEKSYETSGSEKQNNSQADFSNDTEEHLVGEENLDGNFDAISNKKNSENVKHHESNNSTSDKR